MIPDLTPPAHYLQQNPANIEVIPIDKVNEAFDRVVAKDVRFRFVIDNSTLPQAGA
jgi:alcohol dehydrogenase (NADP+)